MIFKLYPKTVTQRLKFINVNLQYYMQMIVKL